MLIVRTFALLTCLSALAPGTKAGDTTTLISRTPGGVPVGGVNSIALSEDGRYFIYATDEAAHPRDQNASGDVYLLDRHTEELEVISADMSGGAAGNSYGWLTVSDDGRYVTFLSGSPDLVDGDTNGESDIFVRDRLLGVTERINLGPGGAQANDFATHAAISGDGRYVCFQSQADNLVPGDTNGSYDIFVRDRINGTTELVSASSSGAQGNDISVLPRISRDGQLISFESEATNLVPGDTNGGRDIFYRDRESGTTVRASVGAGGVQANDCSLGAALSRDGTHLVFISRATNLDPATIGPQQGVFLHEISSGDTKQIHSVLVDWGFCTFSGEAQYPATASDGSTIGFYGATHDPETSGVFRVDTETTVLERVDYNCAGTAFYLHSGLVAMSGDASHVAFLGYSPQMWPGLGHGVESYAFLRGPDLPCAGLEGVPPSLSASLGGSQPLKLSAGPLFAGQRYQLFGTTAGVHPGLPLGELVLPLNFDGVGGYLLYSASHADGVPLSSSLGVLDGGGHASASIDLPPGLASALVGTTLHHAYVVFDPDTAEASAVSLPVALHLEP